MSVRSMTGYAQARRQGAWGEITATLKSVNHRALDLHAYLPMEFDALDPVLRQTVRRKVSRGHVELRLSYRPSEKTAGPSLNRTLFDAYLRALKEASDLSGVLADPDPNRALRIPGMLSQDEAAPLPEETAAEAVRATEDALDALNRFREREGQETVAAMRGHNELIRQYAQVIWELRGAVTEAIRIRLQERISKLFNGMPLEPQRLAQEVAYLVDRSDVSEEVDRLNVHVRELEQLLDQGGELGKKLDFLLQEMNRETNTTLSKTSGAGEPGVRITALGLEIKTSIERIREQALNLE
ncbi:MAG: YicC/YloC family endoribonuclease [Bryobacteraceae bacterium]